MSVCAFEIGKLVLNFEEIWSSRNDVPIWVSELANSIRYVKHSETIFKRILHRALSKIHEFRDVLSVSRNLRNFPLFNLESMKNSTFESVRILL